MKIKFFPILCLFILSSCSRFTTVNLKVHQFSQKPRNIIWLQIPGLTDEHLAMMRFTSNDLKKTTAFEEMACTGKTWSYNLYNIRPTPETGFLSQMSASKNITANCSELPETSMMSFFHEQEYRIGIYEYGTTEQQSFSTVKNCPSVSSKWTENYALWVSRKTANPDAKFFHYQDAEPFDKSGEWFDRSCQGRSCFADSHSNIVSLWERFKSEKGNHVFIIRDFSFYNALMDKKYLLARERLIEIEKTLSRFLFDTQTRKDSLILVTSSAARHIELPENGPDWGDFEKNGTKALFKHSALISPVYSWGARAENFCGLYDESEILGRLLFTPRENRLPLIFTEGFNL